MKILHIINQLEVGGAQRLLSDLAPHINKECPTDVLVLRDADGPFKEILRQRGVTVYSLHAKCELNPLLALKVRNFIRNYDIVHVHLFPSLYWASMAYRLLRGKRPKLYCTEHSTLNKRRDKKILRGLEKWVYSAYNRIICISGATKRNLGAWIDDDSDRLTIVHNGIDIESFENPKQLTEKPILMMVSRLSHQKDPETLIKSVPYINKDVEVWFIGDGAERAESEALVAEMNLGDKVKFLGTRDDVPKLLSKAAIGIQSSKWEGFGLTVVEIMASGTPVIASDVPGLAGVVDDAGLLFKPGDERELADKINAVLADPKLYDQLVAKGRVRARQFSIVATKDAYLDQYRQK